MKKIVFLIFILSGLFCYAQNAKSDVQIIHGSDLFTDTTKGKQDQKPAKENNGKSYIPYKVEPGDTWNSIAAKYGLTYAELRMANQEGDKLIAGKNINIPSDKLKANDPYFQKKFIDEDKKAVSEKETFKYHTVAKGQTLYSISKLFNVSVDLIKEWNNLSNNSISVGEKLIVGKSKAEVKVEKETTPVKSSGNETKISSPPSNKNTEVNKIVAVPDKKPVAEPVKENSSKEKIEKGEQSTGESSGEKIVFANGRHEVNENGKALCMDEDDFNMEKYYALHRTAPIGTIIRVMNKSNSKKIYVKVIGSLPDNSENEGAIIKVSKASAEKLGVHEKSFQAGLLYGVN